jgi:thiaminase/transcriptional activator TenA
MPGSGAGAIVQSAVRPEKARHVDLRAEITKFVSHSRVGRSVRAISRRPFRRQVGVVEVSMTSHFTDELWRDAQPIWQAIVAHPFLAEIQAGTLPLESFRYYVGQDYHYLEGFARTVATALAKAPTAEHLALIARRVLTPIERPLHERLFALAGLDPTSVSALPLAPTNLAYQNHMLAVAGRGGLGETAAALLPCPWTYHELGNHVTDVDHQIYGPWAAFYSEGLLADSVRAWRSFVDDEAAEAGPRTRAAMRQAFFRSMRYEWMFWEMAYRREEWPI